MKMNLPDESGRSEKEPEWRRISPDLQDFYKNGCLRQHHLLLKMIWNPDSSVVETGG